MVLVQRALRQKKRKSLYKQNRKVTEKNRKRQLRTLNMDF